MPPASSGVDRAALKTAAEGELRGVDASKLRARKKRDVVVSVAVVGSTPSPFACTVNALLYDAKTGTMLAIIQGHAHSEGAANDEVRKRVLRAAVRSAVSQIPDALRQSATRPGMRPARRDSLRRRRCEPAQASRSIGASSSGRAR